MKKALTCLVLLCCMMACRAFADTGTITVKADQPGVNISPMLYGLMTEEINHAYDGGLYGELIQNGTFKNSRQTPIHWGVVQNGGGTGSIELDETQSVNAALTTCLKLTISNGSPTHRVGISNDGYWGIPVRANSRYKVSYWAKASKGFIGTLQVSIESENGGTTLARAIVRSPGAVWQQYTTTLTTGRVAPSQRNRIVISAGSAGSVWFNRISLFPATFNGRENGLRPDLMQLMGAMKPAFLRFPGGNYLEGNTIAERFDWKKTIGPVSQRAGHQCPWGYWSTDGMGLLEFLTWCEDLKMEPMLCVFAGYALRGEHIGAGPGLAPFVTDALDEIEYITGAAGTRWGAERVKNGHPAPFKLHYVEIGNEDWFDRSGSYDGRYAQFHDAIKTKYPGLEIIATAPVRSRTPDVMDDHYYRTARDMERDVHHYDNHDRKGPKIFVGEWASTEGSPTPTLNAALGDAAWMTGMERNSDLVTISCYAPLLVNVNPGARQWGTNLIGYDALNSFGSPSYYVQKMFANNRGDVVLPVDIALQQQGAPPNIATSKGSIGVGTWITQAEYKDIKVTQGNKTLYLKDFATGLDGWKPSDGAWKTEGGVLRQTSMSENCRAIAGDSNWSDYTYSLKARKLSGAEGFLILFHVKDQENYIWWNIGGWGNTRSAVERSLEGGKQELGRPNNSVRIETGRWYDIRIETQGHNIRCYLDDKLITATVDTGPLPVDPIYATASRDYATGDIILKVVNVSGVKQDLDIKLQGVNKQVYYVALEVISGQPGDVNSITEPEKVVPKRVVGKTNGSNHVLLFPPYSVSVLRIKTR